jgi:hypothetical protein
MAVLSRKRASLRKTESLLIFALYLAVTTSIDLFHTENCVFNTRHTGKTDAILSDDPCPACAFLAGHHSTQLDYSPALLTTEHLFISQLLAHSQADRSDEWACSIVSRAPPTITIS